MVAQSYLVCAAPLCTNLPGMQSYVLTLGEHSATLSCRMGVRKIRTWGPAVNEACGKAFLGSDFVISTCGLVRSLPTPTPAGLAGIDTGSIRQHGYHIACCSTHCALLYSTDRPDDFDGMAKLFLNFCHPQPYSKPQYHRLRGGGGLPKAIPC